MKSAADPRILVIDDNQNVVDMVSTFLRGEGYRVLAALTGDEGLKLAMLTRIRSMNPNVTMALNEGVDRMTR